MEHIIILMIGNRSVDHEFIGPFSTKEKALTYANINLKGEPWSVTSLSSPEKDEDDEDTDLERMDEDDWGDYDYDEEYMRNRMFADPGGNSALRAATKNNPRNLPCPTCHQPNLLTPEDVRLGYCCDRCADRAERVVDP